MFGKKIRLVVCAAAVVLLSLLRPVPGQAATMAERQQTCYQYLTETMGLPPAAACGIMANIERESSFNPKCTNSDKYFGLVQWNPDRKSALQTFCRKNNLDANSIEGQLAFLNDMAKDELAAMKTFHNDAYGAYKAGFYWCYHFERPGQYLTAAVSRGILARDKYWDQFGRQGAETKALGNASLTGVSVPGHMTVGTRFELSGTVRADTTLTRVSAGFYYMNEKPVSTAEANPGSSSFALSALASEIHPENLAVGTYIFEITASNGSVTEPLLKRTVHVFAKEAKQKDANVRFLCVNNRAFGLKAQTDGSICLKKRETKDWSGTDTIFQVGAYADGWYSIRSLSDGGYLTAGKNGALGLLAWSGSDAQLWQFLSAGGTMMTLIPKSQADLLVSLETELKEGEKVLLAEGTLDARQLFRIVDSGDKTAIEKPKAETLLTGTATLTVPKKKISKTYSTKTFSLGAESDGKLSYASSNTKVAKVDKSGNVKMTGYGKAVLTIKAKKSGANSKTVKVTLTVKPKKLTVSSCKSPRAGRMVATWKRDTMADGYQLQYSKDSAFPADETGTITSKNNKPKKCTVKSLERKTVYYMRMRAYRKVDDKKIYGAWTKVKQITIR